MECAECGNPSQVLMEDKDGTVTPLCEQCYDELKEIEESEKEEIPGEDDDWMDERR